MIARFLALAKLVPECSGDDSLGSNSLPLRFSVDCSPGSTAGRSIVIESADHVKVSTPRAVRVAQWAQAGILFGLYLTPILWCFRTAGFADPDVWWHMRSGQWVLQHHVVPHTDPFSSFGAGRPWSAYNWLFDIIIFKLYDQFGLAGLVIYSVVMILLFVVLLHRLIRHRQQDFTIGVLLTLIACYCLTSLDSPRSWWISINFFVLELDILMRARTSGKSRGLVWLPLIFALWVNLHMEFVFGFLLLFLALAESLAARRIKLESQIRPRQWITITVLCLLATLVNPYGWGIYRIVLQLATQQFPIYKVIDFQPLGFRSLSDFIVLFLALFAAAALARARRIALFETALLAFAVVMSFRSQRDTYLVVVAACAILALEINKTSESRFYLKTPAIVSVACAAAFAAAFALRVSHVDNARMQMILADRLPARAVAFVKARGYPGPLFNDFAWGGYLMWDLRMPVAIDGRAPLYDDSYLDNSLATWSGSPGWSSDPDLARAGLVIGPAGSALTQLLRMDPRFKLVFEDKVAAVFVAVRNVSADSH